MFASVGLLLAYWQTLLLSSKYDIYNIPSIPRLLVSSKKGLTGNDPDLHSVLFVRTFTTVLYSTVLYRDFVPVDFLMGSWAPKNNCRHTAHAREFVRGVMHMTIISSFHRSID